VHGHETAHAIEHRRYRLEAEAIARADYGMLTRSAVPGRGIPHLDLAVAEVQRSLDFYRMLLEPLGLTEYDRTPSYRGTEEVVYLHFGRSFFGVRPAGRGALRVRRRKARHPQRRAVPGGYPFAVLNTAAP
jgi:catechol 2,3-dioxygenase-like lactoylglutathione lyase family enzyme